MTQAISFKRIAVEATTIIVSILFAFAIDAYWDSYQQRQRLELNLNALVLDMQTAKTTIDYTIIDNTATVEELRGALSALQTDQADLSELNISVNIRVPVIPSGTLKLLVNSGDVRSIRDETVRSILITGLSKIELFQGFMDDLATDGRASSVQLVRAESEAIAAKQPWPEAARGNAKALASLQNLGNWIDNIKELSALLSAEVEKIEQAALLELQGEKTSSWMPMAWIRNH